MSCWNHAVLIRRSIGELRKTGCRKKCPWFRPWLFHLMQLCWYSSDSCSNNLIVELSAIATDDLRSNADVFHLFAFFGELRLIAQKDTPICSVKLIPPIALFGELWLFSQKPSPIFAVKLIPPIALFGELRLIAQKPYPFYAVKLIPLVALFGELWLKLQKAAPI